MRDKGEILSDSLKFQAKYPVWGGTTTLHEQLTIEVLIDIRDQLNSLYSILCTVQDISFRPG